MAKDTNKVVMIGRLTKHADLEYTQGGTAVVKFSLANNWRRKTGEEWKEEVSFFDCVLYGRRGEGLQRYLTKGTRVALECEARQHRWEKDGATRSRVQFVIDELQLLGSPTGQNSASGEPPMTPHETERPAHDDDEVPF